MIHDINVEININTNTITIENADSLQANDNRIIFTAISVVDGENSSVEFNRFKCGFYVRDNNNTTVEYKTYPPAGDAVNYSPDGVVLNEFLDELDFNEDYTLQVYVEDAGVFYDKTINISIPKSIRPYDHNGDFDSWTWNDTAKIWEAPVAKPDDPNDGFYKWDEQNQEWVLFYTTPFE